MRISANTPAGSQMLLTPLIKKQAKISSCFSDKLEQLHQIENHVMPLLQKAKRLASDVRLKAAINDMIRSTQEKTAYLEKAYGSISGKVPKGGMLQSCCDEFISLTGDFDAGTDTKDAGIRDAAIIFEIQKMVQFKIEHYSILCELADAYNNKQLSQVTEKILQSEICCDASLMDLSVVYFGYDEDDMTDFTGDEE